MARGQGVGHAGCLGNQGTFKHLSFVLWKTIMYNSRINPSWLVVCAGAMLDEGVAVPLVVDIATVLTKAGFE